MRISCMVYGISFLLAGIWLAWGQGHTHLSAWKKMSEEEKAKIKIIPLSRNIGEVITLNGVIFLLKGICPGFTNHWFTTAILAWMLVAGLDVLYIGKSGRYHSQ